MDALQQAALIRARYAIDMAAGGPVRQPGLLASRYLKSLAGAEEPGQAARFAEERRYGDTIVKAALGAASTSSAPALQEVHADFLAAVRARSLVGRLLPRLRKLPPRTPTIRQTGGTSAAWVPEGASIPMTAGTFTKDAQLQALKVAAIAATTKELARAGIADTLIGDDLIRACAAAIDATFASTDAAVPDASPAGIFNGASAGASAGPGADGARADVDALLAALVGNIDTAVFITNTRSAAQLAMLDLAVLNPSGESTLAGLPLYFSDAVPAVLGLVDAARIEIVGFDEAELDVSREGLLQMDTEPTGTSIGTPVATQQVSLWQTGTVGLRGEISVNWRVAPGAAAYVSNVDYGPIPASS